MNETMKLVVAMRSPVRRQIMLAAEEAYAAKKPVTAKSLSVAVGKPLNNVSYYVRELLEAGALEVVGGSQRRGAWQRAYAPTKLFQATMTDTVALDQIAELIDGAPVWTNGMSAEIGQIIRATGRPVEA